jgi:hypothetical protein
MKFRFPEFNMIDQFSISGYFCISSMGFWSSRSFCSQSYIVIHDLTAVENKILQEISRVSYCSGYRHFGWRFNVLSLASGRFERFCFA